MGGWVGGGVGGKGGCERRIEVWGKFTIKKIRGVGGGREGAVRWGGGLVGVQGGCERTVGGRG